MYGLGFLFLPARYHCRIPAHLAKIQIQLSEYKNCLSKQQEKKEECNYSQSWQWRKMFQGGKKNNAAYTNQFKLLLTLAMYLQMARGNSFYELTK